MNFQVQLRKLVPKLPAQGKAILISGCDSGFGLGFAKHLTDKGCEVFAGCLMKDKNGEGSEELLSLKKPNLHVIQLDVTSSEQTSKSMKEIEGILNAKKLNLWGVVNNAGIGTYGEVEWIPINVYEKIASVNIWGMIRLTQACLPHLRRSKGRVVNVSSMLGRMGYPMRSPYCITKFAVEAFSDCLRYEMKPWGVHVAAMEPGNYIAGTNIFTPESVDAAAGVMWNNMSEAVRKDYGKEYFDSRVKKMHSYITGGVPDFRPVLNALDDALFSKNPRPRYLPANLYYTLRVLAATHLPESIYERFYKDIQ